MISPTEENAPLLDPRLQFPVHTLPNERVVWSGSADARAYRAALLRAVWAIAAFALLALFVVHNGIDVDAPCARSDEIASKAAIDRDCSASVRTERAERLRAFQRGATRLALGAIAAALLLQWIANALRRRHLATRRHARERDRAVGPAGPGPGPVATAERLAAAFATLVVGVPPQCVGERLQLLCVAAPAANVATVNRLAYLYATRGRHDFIADFHMHQIG